MAHEPWDRIYILYTGDMTGMLNDPRPGFKKLEALDACLMRRDRPPGQREVHAQYTYSTQYTLKCGEHPLHKDPM